LKKESINIINLCGLPVGDCKVKINRFVGVLTENGNLASVLIYRSLKNTFYLVELATHPEHRRQGHATILMDILKDLQSTKDVVFFCDPERVAFYKKRGGVVVKRRAFRSKVPKIRVPRLRVCMTILLQKKTLVLNMVSRISDGAVSA
jgi:hypothetical protein